MCQYLEELSQSLEKFYFDSWRGLWRWASGPGHSCNCSPRLALCYLEHDAFQCSTLCLRSVLLEKGLVCCPPQRMWGDCTAFEAGRCWCLEHLRAFKIKRLFLRSVPWLWTRHWKPHLTFIFTVGNANQLLAYSFTNRQAASGEGRCPHDLDYWSLLILDFKEGKMW